ncbi:MAG: YfbU family protein [candidate division Zixibacteria bacterium]|nr:YfbU family protein [candidate division Zixibacteria bacterium]
MSNSRIQLSLKDRLFLSNQYRILEAICPDEAFNFKRLRTIVENGYELHYDALNSMISESRLTVEDCQEIMDILDMYRSLKFCFDKLKDKEGVSEEDIRFQGFDANEETNRFFYTRFLVLQERRWQEILEGRPGLELNSHRPIIELYQRMLAEWNKIGKRFDLSLQDIRQILAERIHPDNRK